MSGRLGRGLLGAALAVGLLVTLVEPSRADDVRPVQLVFRELPSGDFAVQWSVPKQIPVNAMPSPVLPDRCRPAGARTLIERPTAWLTRQVYRCPHGLAGRTIGVDYPFYNMRFSTLLRVDLLSGERYTHLLDPGTDVWTVPDLGEGGLQRELDAARAALLEGARHVFDGWVPILFVLAISLLGGARTSVRLVSAFFMAQVCGVLAGSVLHVALAPPLAEVGVALAAVLIAREALRAQAARSQLVALAAGAGVAHGLGIAGLAALVGEALAPSLGSMLLFALGIDMSLLIATVPVSIFAAWVTRKGTQRGLVTTTAYITAGLAVALAIHAVAVPPAAAAKEAREKTLRLPDLPGAAGGAALPGSGRVAASAPDAPIQAYVTVEPFEIRCETLLRLRHLGHLVGADAGLVLTVQDQADVARRIRAHVLERMSVEIDGETRAPSRDRVDFMTLDSNGALPRPAPVPESIDGAWVGVTAVYSTATTPRRLAFAWSSVDPNASVPATVIDPEASRSVLLTPDEPVLAWENELTEDPAPHVSATVVEPERMSLPFWSLLLLTVAVIIVAFLTRRRRPALAFAVARFMFALAVVAGPFGIVAFAAPGTDASTPTNIETKRILTNLLPNVYRALEFREESAVFDHLALSVEGESLHDVYLQQRRGLEMEERGGAQSRVEAVDVIDVPTVEPAEDGGFVARAEWTVAGMVTHFGHRHFRQNRYDAVLTVVPVKGVWKLRSVDVRDEQRIR